MIASGYIVAVDFTIYGSGRYGHEAMEDFEKNLELQDIKLIDADTDVLVLEHGPQYIRREDIRTLPATAALLDAVRDGGDSILFVRHGNIACLPNEIRW